MDALFFFVAVIEVSNATLRFIISSPTENLTFFIYTDSMMLSSFNLNRILRLILRPLNKGWRAYILFVTNSELAMVVQTPGKQLIFVIFIKRRVCPTKHINCIFSSNSFNLQSLLIFSSRFQNPPNFTTFSITPSPYFAICGHTQSMMCTRYDLCDSRFAFPEKVFPKGSWQVSWITNSSRH